MTALIAVLTVVVILLTVLIAGLLRSHAEMLRAFNELGITFGNEGGHVATVDPPTRNRHASDRVIQSTGDGSVHDIAGTTPRGGSTAVALIGRNERTLLAFLTSGCTTCKGFWDAFRNDAALPRSVDRLVIVTKSNDEESPSSLLNLAPDRHVVVMSSQAWDDYGVPVSPYFVLVDGPSATIDGEGAASTWAQVGSLLSQAEADAELENEKRIDLDLRRAGIEPNDPRLYPEQDLR